MPPAIPRNKLINLIGMVGLNNFALGLISIFVPIYLLQIGYSFETVMVWFIIHHSCILIGAFGTMYLSNKIGLVRSLHVRFLFLITELLLLLALPTHPWLFYLIPVITGLESALYWMPVNILLVRNTTEETMGSSMSKFFAYPNILSIWSPLIGAAVAYYFGFPILFILSALILALAITPILSLASAKTDFKFTWFHAKEIYKKNKRFFLPEVIDNLAEDAGVIWSVFVYIQLVSIVQIGLIGTLTAIAGVFFTLTIGKLTDQWDKRKLIRIGAVLVSLMWFLNFLIGEYIPNQWLFYIASIGMTLSLKVFLVPYSSVLFNRARKDDAQFIVLREIPTILGRLILYGLAIVLSDRIPYLFIFVALVFIYFWFVDFRRLERNDGQF